MKKNNLILLVSLLHLATFISAQNSKKESTLKPIDSLTQKMQLYKDSGRIFRIDNELFNETSWLAVMHGQGLRSEGYHPLVDRMSTSLIDERLTHIASVIDKSASVLPEHAQFIAQLG